MFEQLKQGRIDPLQTDPAKGTGIAMLAYYTLTGSGQPRRGHRNGPCGLRANATGAKLQAGAGSGLDITTAADARGTELLGFSHGTCGKPSASIEANEEQRIGARGRRSAVQEITTKRSIPLRA